MTRCKSKQGRKFLQKKTGSPTSMNSPMQPDKFSRGEGRKFHPELARGTGGGGLDKKDIWTAGLLFTSPIGLLTGEIHSLNRFKHIKEVTTVIPHTGFPTM